MQNVLDQYLKEYDKNVYPERVDEINYATELMKNRFRKNMQKIGLSAESSDEEILEYWKNYLKPTKRAITRGRDLH